MFQEPTQYLPVSGYALPNSLPQYNFGDPLRLSNQHHYSDHHTSHSHSHGSVAGVLPSTSGVGVSSVSVSSAAANAAALLYSANPILAAPDSSSVSTAAAAPPPPIGPAPSAAPSPQPQLEPVAAAVHQPVSQIPVSAPASTFPFVPSQSATAGTTTTIVTTTAPPPTTAASAHHTHTHTHTQAGPSLAFSQMDPDPHSVAAQEAAAREYQPQHEGPLVGEKTPSTKITEEYAKADPTYVQKTMVLPQTYSHYRPIRGDGNCGWRAIAFGYFETLVKKRSKDTILTERARLESLYTYIEVYGGQPRMVFEDLAQTTLDLLDTMAQLSDNVHQALAKLLEEFNNEHICNAIMFHFRLLASSYLKEHRDQYGPFLENADVDRYCQTVLEPHGIEIEHLGLILLTEILLKPAGFVLEVAYLDRSPGSQVNTYRFPEEANSKLPSQLGPTIYLLYRPGHYDLLYVPEPEPVNIQVHRVSGFSQGFQIAATPVASYGFGLGGGGLGALTMIPGFSGSSAFGSDLFGAPPSSPLGTFTPAPPPLSLWNSIPSHPPFASTLQQAAPPPPPPQPQPTPIHHIPSAPAPTPATPAPPPPAPTATTAQTNNPVRFSEYCKLQKYVENPTWKEQQTLQTSTFKNSHYNTAHFNNPNFQPEEYKPGEEHEREGRRRRRKDIGDKDKGDRGDT